jgi:hypothetical protein
MVKKAIFFFMIFVLGVSFVYGSGNQNNDPNRITGNGNMVTVDRPMEPFEKIQVVGSASMRYHLSPEYRVSITVDSNIVEYVETESINNKLKIEMSETWKSYSFKKLIVDIYCRAINDVLITGSGSLELVDKLETSSLRMNIAGAGGIDGSIDCNTLDIHVSGSGDISLKGNVDNGYIAIIGSGDFRGEELKMNEATLILSGTGRMNGWVENDLTIVNSGTGSITYRGNPLTDISNSGFGKVTKRE